MGMIIMNGKEYTSSPKDGFPPIIYSDEEREIGVWRDGRPLYQKTINVDFVNGRRDYQHGIQNVDTIFFDDSATFIYAKDKSEFDHFYNAGYNDSAQFVEGFARFIQNVSRTTIILKANPNLGTNYSAIITVRYTKTTDTPGSGKYTTYGGLAHHYSENEQVVGTWVDGKPLYQKTIYIASVTSGTSYQHNISNVKDISIYEIRAKRNTGWYSSGHIFQNGINNITESFSIIPSSTVLYAYLFGNTITDCYVTVRYTKITD